MTKTTFAVGSLVRARGREWVVLPETREGLVIVRPLGGTEDEVTGILTSLEAIEPASFPLPKATEVGDYRSGRLLRDAVRLGVRWSAGPFRSFGRIAVEPRPYQLVPLLMGLKLDPVRLLIADDVGIGKTVEACLVARELLDRGECQRLAVLCPPQLAEQWQKELEEKFHLDSELVLAGTVRRLERGLDYGQSLFERYPRVVVSIDYIKADRRRDEFVRNCPELVIVDEAHSCSYGDRQGRARHQRHTLVRALADDPGRHMILVTATPHSGNETAFRSLLSYLRADFADLPQDLTGPQNAKVRREVAAHFVQRRRADIRHYMDDETVFPDREDTEQTYRLSPAYRKLLERVLAYARETVADESGGRHRQRVRWWSALALLRALASSPAAAAATLRSRSAAADTVTTSEADEVGRRQVLDLEDTESADALDVIPGSDPGEGEVTPARGPRGAGVATDETEPAEAGGLEMAAERPETAELEMAAERSETAELEMAAERPETAELEMAAARTDSGQREGQAANGLSAATRRRLREFAREAEALEGEGDTKLLGLVKILKAFLKDDYQPIVFCRFIPTAEYVGAQLRERLPKAVRVEVVTGTLPPEEREQRVASMGEADQRVLVCTDCLSEGINLQENFNAVIHYDLSWNPTRHEQREGRVDRYGQSSPVVRTMTYYGSDNGVDGMVLEVLLRKHRTIRSSLGISVPLPGDTNAVVEAIFEGLLLRNKGPVDQINLGFIQEDRDHLHLEWDNVTAREKRSRTMFAQEGVKVDAVAQELAEIRQAIGTGADVERFLRDAVKLHGGDVSAKNGSTYFGLTELPQAMREACGRYGESGEITARFKLPVPRGVVYLSRTHPMVEGLADYVMNATMDAHESTKARRCGVVMTGAVAQPVTLLLMRFRYHLISRNGSTRELLAEEVQPLAYRDGTTPEWLTKEEIDALLQAAPAGNLGAQEQAERIEAILDRIPDLRAGLDRIAAERGEHLLDSHKRVRKLAQKGRVRYEVRPELPADLLGIYVFVPAEG